VVKTDCLTITEYFGNATTQEPRLSAAHVVVSGPGSEAWQTPDFDEYVLITSGEVHILHAGGKTVVKEGSGVLLPAKLRVKWVFQGPCSYVPICMPDFSPDSVHREEGTEGAEDAPVAEPHAGEGPAIITPVDVVKAPSLTITEFFGNVASKDSRMSACVATVSDACEEAYQAPEFAEYVLVLDGEVHLQHAEGTAVVGAGKAAYLKEGERVKWVWPGKCTYVPICLPAFSPTNCHREEEEGAAKDKEAMDRLHALHDEVEDGKAQGA